MGIIEGSMPRDAIRQAVVAGDDAGEITVSGIKGRDRLVSVLQATEGDEALTGITDLSAEFTVADADTIDNTDGTDTSGSTLIVTWLAVG
ncbi:hypothetical protein [Streptomyces sp. NBRC 109706]|uniref:hypothetical protein n=1 Tax=Streptomyces sp. NBRC 109706 TaxID=1550035 RepID=UPI0007839889|nr:hypothetical protein [Streptomyces sp. NBRC 109706]